MSRNKGYVYVSKNRVDRPQFRPRSSSDISTHLSIHQDRQDGVVTPPNQRAPPPPVPPVPPLPTLPPLPTGAAVEAPQHERIPSPEVDRGFYSSADAYSHGRLPLEPPWSRPDPLPKYKPVSPTEEKRIFVRLDDDPRTASPSSDGKTASASVSPSSDSPPEAQTQRPSMKKRNTLKKKIPKIISKRKEESVVL